MAKAVHQGDHTYAVLVADLDEFPGLVLIEAPGFQLRMRLELETVVDLQYEDIEPKWRKPLGNELLHRIEPIGPVADQMKSNPPGCEDTIEASPAAALNEKIKHSLREHKPALLELLRAESSPRCPRCDSSDCSGAAIALAQETRKVGDICCVVVGFRLAAQRSNVALFRHTWDNPGCCQARPQGFDGRQRPRQAGESSRPACGGPSASGSPMRGLTPAT
jgi:hypothetical protein